MTAEEIRQVVKSTLAGLIGEQLTGGRSAPSNDENPPANCCAKKSATPKEVTAAQIPPSALGFSIPLEVSARHVHLTQEALGELFGLGSVLERKRMLSQPGEFLSDKRVKLVTPKGELDGVAVLGPVRNRVQVELSASDCRRLGLNAPVKLSGDLSGAADILLKGSGGEYCAKGSTIIARNHIHCAAADARRLGIKDGQTLSVRANTARPVIFEDVPVRVNESFALAMHIDTDEANACGYSDDAQCSICAAPAQSFAKKPEPKEITELCFCADKVITEICAKELIKNCRGEVKIAKSSVITPSAKDVFLHARIKIERV